jgi:hypothetical protein
MYFLLERLPVIVALLCGAYLLKRRAWRPVALCLIGAFCTQLWVFLFGLTEYWLLHAGIFEPMSASSTAWSVLKTLVILPWWAACWVYMCYKVALICGCTAIRPLCPNCACRLDLEAKQCPKCRKAVTVAVRYVAVSANVA